MEGLKLQTSKRSVLGKRTKLLRREGITPVHLFGHGLESLPLQCDTANLQRVIAQAGTTRLIALEIEGDRQPRSVFIREIQRDVTTRALLHVDFYQIQKRERIKAEVPIILVGEAPALKEKGRSLTRGVSSLNVESLPDMIPPQIKIDLSPLEEVEQAIHVRDIVLHPDITVITDPDQLVVKIGVARVERVEEAVVAAEVVAEEAAAEAEAPAKEAPEQKP